MAGNYLPSSIKRTNWSSHSRYWAFTPLCRIRPRTWKRSWAEKQREINTVEGYLAKNNIKAEKTDKGTYVVVENPGSGPQVDSGKQIFVRYTGKFLPSGKVFESNMTGPGNDPIKFIAGQGGVIPGWDDGLKKFKKGGKGTLYIPAFMAYNQGPGPDRKPFENLMFDIEVVDVTDAPKQ